MPAQYLWHAFSYGVVPAARGYDAELQYEAAARGVDQLYVISGSDQLGAGIIDASAQRFPGLDVLVSPIDFASTMAFTHESDIGPFFARASAVVDGQS